MAKRFKFSEEDQTDYGAKILKKLEATTADYLKYTYFNIFDTQALELKQEFNKRCNNIIFNNHLEISRQLAKTVFVQKAEERLLTDLGEVKFVSYIFPETFYLHSTPLLLQYFHKTNGLQHRFLKYMFSSNDLVHFLNDLNISEKFVGFCGNYSFMDPAKTDFMPAYFKNINSIRMIHYLPYCESFLDNLVNMIVSYLPNNIRVSLEELGNHLLESFCTDRPRIQMVRKEFKKWKNSKKEHILLSNYTQSVIDNFTVIKRYLSELMALSCSLEGFNCVQTRCDIVFIREIFLELKKREIKENFAILFYDQIKTIQAELELYEADTYFPYVLEKTIQKQSNIIRRELTHPEETLKKLNTNMVEIVDKVYKRAIMYLRFLSANFKEFDCFVWILLKDLQVNFEHVHRSYHILKPIECAANCDNFDKLKEEVESLNQFLPNITSSAKEFLEAKWLKIFENVVSISIISDIVEYVLSLPASATSLFKDANLDNAVPDDEISEVNTVLKFNLKLQNNDIENINAFLGEQYVSQAEQIIEEHQVKQLID